MRTPLRLLSLCALVACDSLAVPTAPSAVPGDASAGANIYGYYCALTGAFDSLSNAQLDSLPPLPSGPSAINGDDDWAWLAGHVPGCWAGAYLTPVKGKNSLVLLFVEATQFSAAVDSLQAYEHSMFVRRTDPSDSLYGFGGKRVLWSWRQLYAWRKYIEWLPHPELDPLNMTVIGIDVVQNRIEVDYASTADSAAAVRAFRRLHAPTGLIHVGVGNVSELASCVLQTCASPFASQ